MPYIKSHSNYVLRKKHQVVDGGTIYERDITTIGGKDNFSAGRVPMYSSGNFIITTNDDASVPKAHSSMAWEQNPYGDIWTLDVLSEYTKDYTSSDEKLIEIKKDYYNLRDFAYYGSCSEMIRASINDILNKFPGELYVPFDETPISAYTSVETEIDDDGNVTVKNVTSYTSSVYTIPEGSEVTQTDMVAGGIPIYYTINNPFIKGGPFTVRLGQYLPITQTNGKCRRDSEGSPIGEDNLILVDNPFGIDIHSKFTKEDITAENALKFFLNDGYKNYNAVDESGNTYDISYTPICEASEFTELTDEGYVKNTSTNTTLIIRYNSSENRYYEELVLPGCTTSNPINENSNTQYTVDYGMCIGDEIGNGIEIRLYGNENVFEVNPSPTIEISVEGEERDIDIDSYEETYEITSGTSGYKIRVFVGDEYQIYYLIDGSEKFPYHIRPKQSFYDEYIANLDLFEKVLMNTKSDPQYTATFNIIDENEYGYYTTMQRFTFPTTYGGYNLGSNGEKFNNYLSRLSRIGSFYDERFSDNLYRSLTHESIKNFDWTYTKQRTDDDEQDLLESGEKISNIIRVFGREFDELRNYIDNIITLNTVTYDNRNNLPDYFFTDALESDGWDLKQVIPLSLHEYIGDNPYSNNISEYTTEEEEKQNLFYGGTSEFYSGITSIASGVTLHRQFNQIEDLRVKPYSIKYDEFWGNGVFYGCYCGPTTSYTFSSTVYSTTHDSSYGETLPLYISSYSETSGDSTSYHGFEYFNTDPNGEVITSDTFVDCAGVLRRKIKNYTSENEWTMPEVNNEFMKRLILNSREIWRHKGTLDGIDMLLGMFGYRSRRWYESLPSGKTASYFSYINSFEPQMKPYDYEIKEYTSFTKRIEDPWSSELGMYKYEWYNNGKDISYDTEEFRQGISVPYEGLPVVYRNDLNTPSLDINGNVNKDAEGNIVYTRYIYPSFNDYRIHDGNPYYQMNGGWGRKSPFGFDKDNNLVVMTDEIIPYTETMRYVRSVENLKELMQLPYQLLTDGDIVKVNDLSNVYAIVDGICYDVSYEKGVSGETNMYFSVWPGEAYTTVGTALFSDRLIVSSPYGYGNRREYHLSSGDYNNIEIKIYILELKDDEGNVTGYTMEAFSEDSSVSTFTMFINGKYTEGDNLTNYFRINDIEYSNELSSLGWQQLRNSDQDYIRINSIIDYYKGNNPHTGHMHYDNGHEYFTYFSRLFKFAEDNDLFNYNYISYYQEPGGNAPLEINEFGFKGLINDDNCQYNYDDYMTEDSKIHSFCDFINSDNGYDMQYTIDPITSESAETIYNLGDIAPCPKYHPDVLYGSNFKADLDDEVQQPIDGVTNQIVNNKVTDIIFYMRNDNCYSSDGLEEIKYIDSIVIPYMEQVIPSTSITRIEYRYRGKNVVTYTVYSNDEDAAVLFSTDGNEWKLVGYIEQGICKISMDEKESISEYLVKLEGDSMSSYTLNVSSSYHSSGYEGDTFTVDVSAFSYRKYYSVENGSEYGDSGEIGIVERNGEITISALTEPLESELSYSVVDISTMEEADWISGTAMHFNGEEYVEGVADISDSDYYGLSATTFVNVSENPELSTRNGILTFYYGTRMSRVRIHQSMDNVIVHYTLVTNAKEGAVATFKDDDDNILAEIAVNDENQGLLTYSCRRYGSPEYVTATIEGRLPSDTKDYAFVTDEILDNKIDIPSTGTGEDYVIVPISAYCITSTYEYDKDSVVIYRNSSDSINYVSNESSASTDFSMATSAYWISSPDNGISLSAQTNTSMSTRSTILNYYIDENPSTEVQIMAYQYSGEYVFKWDSSVIDCTNDYHAYCEMDYSAFTETFSDCIISTLNGVQQGFSVSRIQIPENDWSIYASTTPNGITVTTSKNTMLEKRTGYILLSQEGSNKQIQLTIYKKKVVPDIGDIFGMDSLHTYFVSTSDDIPQSMQPIGVLVIPEGYISSTDGYSHARIIALRNVSENKMQFTSSKYEKSDYRHLDDSIGMTLVDTFLSFDEGGSYVGDKSCMSHENVQYNEMRHPVIKNNIRYYFCQDAYEYKKGRIAPAFSMTTEETLDGRGKCISQAYINGGTINKNIGTSDIDGLNHLKTALSKKRISSLEGVNVLYKSYFWSTTNYTRSGQWYCPTIGELAAVVPNLKIIENAILYAGGNAMGEKEFFSFTAKWEHSECCSWAVDMSNGKIEWHERDKEIAYLRAFLQISYSDSEQNNNMATIYGIDNIVG